MSGEILTFLRTEKKFVVDDYQKNELIKLFDEYMELDPYCVDNKTYHLTKPAMMIYDVPIDVSQMSDITIYPDICL